MKHSYSGGFDIFELVESQRRGADPALAKRERGILEVLAQKNPEVKIRGGVPLPTPTQARDLQLSTATAGGNLGHSVLTDIAGAARPATVLERLGAPVVELRQAAEGSLPVFAGTPSGMWIGTEGGAIPQFDPTINSVLLTAHEASVRLSYSRRLAAMSEDRAALQADLLRELGQIMASTLEEGFIKGTNSQGQPLGLLNVTGRQTKTFAASTPTWAELTGMVEQLGDADARLESAAWVMHPSTAADLMATEKSSGSGQYVLDYDGGYRIAGRPVGITTAITEDTVLLADMSKLRLVYFAAPQLLVDRFSHSTTGTVQLVVSNYVDVAVSDGSMLVVGSA